MDAQPVARALLDTSAVIDLAPELTRIAAVGAVSTVTLAELAAGLHTGDALLDATRADDYALISERFEAIPYRPSAARIYGALYTSMRRGGRNPRQRRFDLLIASVAVDEQIPVITRNPRDFEDIHLRLRVIAVPPT